MTKSEVRASRRATAKADRAFAAYRREQKDRETLMPLILVGGISLAAWILNGGWSA